MALIGATLKELSASVNPLYSEELKQLYELFQPE